MSIVDYCINFFIKARNQKKISGVHIGSVTGIPHDRLIKTDLAQCNLNSFLSTELIEVKVFSYCRGIPLNRLILHILFVVMISLVSSPVSASNISAKDWQNAVLGTGELSVKGRLLKKAKAVARQEIINQAKAQFKALIESKLFNESNTDREKLGKKILDHLQSEQGALDKLIGNIVKGKGNETSEEFGGIVMRAINEGTKDWAESGDESKKSASNIINTLFGKVGVVKTGTSIAGKIAGGDYSGAGKEAALQIPWIASVHGTVVKAADLEKRAFRAVRDEQFNNIYRVWKKKGSDRNVDEIKLLIAATPSEGFLGDLKREKKLTEDGTFKLLNKIFQTRLKAELAASALSKKNEGILKWALKDEKNGLLVVPDNLPASGQARDKALRRVFDDFTKGARRLQLSLARDAGIRPGYISRFDLTDLLRIQAHIKRSISSDNFDDLVWWRKKLHKVRLRLVQQLKKNAQPSFDRPDQNQSLSKQLGSSSPKQAGTVAEPESGGLEGKFVGGFEGLQIDLVDGATIHNGRIGYSISGGIVKGRISGKLVWNTVVNDFWGEVTGTYDSATQRITAKIKGRWHGPGGGGLILGRVTGSGGAGGFAGRWKSENMSGVWSSDMIK